MAKLQDDILAALRDLTHIADEVRRSSTPMRLFDALQLEVERARAVLARAETVGAAGEAGAPEPSGEDFKALAGAAILPPDEEHYRDPPWQRVRRKWRELRAGASGGLSGTSGEPAPRLGDERELVQRFSVAMAERLRFNAKERGKSGWEWMTPKQLLRRAEQELGELRRAVESESAALDVAHEAADVGNFCAMLATVYEGVARAGTA